MANSLTDSEAVMLERCSEVGLPTSASARLKAQGVNTFGKLAYALRPPPSDDEIKSLIREGSADPPLGSVAALRRLIFESQTLMTAQVRNMIEHKDEEKRELPAAERAERVKQQAARLAGVRLTGESECSHASYNVVASMVQDNVITYLPPGKFGSRQAELRLEKPKKELDIVNSSLTIRDQKQEASCDTSSALSLHHALHRRSLALDLVGVASYALVQDYHAFLMIHLSIDPPPGYRSTTLHQVLEADRAAWVPLAELTSSTGIKKTSTGAIPLDANWKGLETDPSVVFHLLPLPVGGSVKRPADADDNDGSKRKTKKGKGKKGGGKGRPEPPNIPEELRGLMSFTKLGKPRCWDFNREQGCAKAKTNQECPRGLHTCMRCGGIHFVVQCPKRPK